MNIITELECAEPVNVAISIHPKTLTNLTAKAVVKEFDGGVVEIWGDLNEIRKHTIDSVSIDAEWYEREIEVDDFKGNVTSLLTSQGTFISDGNTRFHILMWDDEYGLPSDCWKSKFAVQCGTLIFVKTSLQNDFEPICNFLFILQLLQIKSTKELKFICTIQLAILQQHL